MSKSQTPTAPLHATASISIFLTNAHLLDLDRSEDWPAISTQTFTSKNTLKSEKNRIRAVEWAFYRLFELWDQRETKDKLQPFFPPLEPLQSLNLRAALFRCINELKKNGDLGKEVIIRKTMFDDCKGEKLQELLASFSTIVVRKILAAGQTGEKSIAGRLAIAKRVTSKEQESLLSLTIAHRASLTALLRNKKILRERYHDFGRVLNAKEQDLDQRFERVVETQGFLDKNIIPDHTVSRLSMLFEKHWQGDTRLVDIVMQGEGQCSGDSLLDRSFPEIWPQISDGTFEGETGSTQQGLLDDLEKRVTKQQARLSQWKDFKEAMQRDTKPRVVPKAQDLTLTRTTSKDQHLRRRREKDFVFSPRKSPRKSGWELDGVEVDLSSTPSLLESATTDGGSSNSASKRVSATTANKTEDKASQSQKRRSMGCLSVLSTGQDDSDDSGFSEISGGQLHDMASPDHAVRCEDFKLLATSGKDGEQVISHGPEKGSSGGPTPANKSISSSGIWEQLRTPYGNAALQQLPIEDGLKDGPSNPKKPEEDDLLAEQIVSMTINAAPTPVKPKLSLVERTRQSIAFASPSKFQGLGVDETKRPPLPATAHKNEPAPNLQYPGSSTLLERTRQSISLLPSKPNASRKSMHERRTSKIYPTNQFETPKKLSSNANDLTPPEELFSPDAGYDSVFKSRPKIAFSPTPSPAPDDRSRMVEEQASAPMMERRDKGQGEESPLGRLATKV